MDFPDSPKKCILVIDDEQAVGNVTCEFLIEAGFDAALETNGVDALHRMEAKPFDVVLLDIYLEYEDGLAFLDHLKARFPSIPVIILTAAGYDQEMMRTALKQGAAGYVGKDANRGDVVAAIRRVLG